RLWLAVALVALFWVLQFVVARLDKPYFYGFLYNMGSAALLSLLFFVWWWTNRRIRLSQRLYGFVVLVGMGVVVGRLCHPSIWFGLLTLGLPVALTAWTVWMLLVKWTAISWSRLGLLAVVALTWGGFTLIRIDGLDSELQADMRWRWSPTAEDLFLAE